MTLRSLVGCCLLGLAVVGCSDGGTLEGIVAGEGSSTTSAATVPATGDTAGTTTVPVPTTTAPTTTTAGGAVEVSVFDLQVGDCFDDPSEAAQVDTVQVLPCTVPHDNEVYALFDLPDGPYPGEDAARSQAETGCLERFAAYVGVDYQSSALEVAYLYPLEREWNELADRGVACFVYRLDLTPLTAPVQGSGI